MYTCKYQIPDYKCKYDSDLRTRDGFCILHSRKADKDEEAFKDALDEHRKKEGDIFVGFCFPSSLTRLGLFFEKNASFERCEFSGDASFVLTRFLGPVSFKYTYFGGEAVFAGANFPMAVDFSFAQFTGRVTFIETGFEGKTLFTGAQFEKFASFVKTKFAKEATFVQARFGEDAIFAGARFGKGISFREATFLGRTLFVCGRNDRDEITQIFSGVETGSEVDFRSVVFAPPDSVIFRDADLRLCRLQGADLRKAEITNAIWPQIGDRIGVYDETLLSQDKPDDWPHVENLYRQLKQNYEDRKDYERARDFHYGEKDVRRRSPKTSGGLWILLTLYYYVSGYGERYGRPLISAGLLFLLSWIGYIYFGLQFKLDSGLKALDLTSVWDRLYAAHYTLRVMTLLKPENLAIPTGHSEIIFTIDSIVGPILIGLFLLAVRQRLKR